MFKNKCAFFVSLNMMEMTSSKISQELRSNECLEFQTFDCWWFIRFDSSTSSFQPQQQHPQHPSQWLTAYLNIIYIAWRKFVVSVGRRCSRNNVCIEASCSFCPDIFNRSAGGSIPKATANHSCVVHPQRLCHGKASSTPIMAASWNKSILHAG